MSHTYTNPVTTSRSHRDAGSDALSTNVLIRQMHAGDLAAASQLTQSLNWPHRMKDWEVHLRLGRGWVVCDTDGSLLGTILWWPCGDGFGTVGLVVVAPSLQGKGIGRRLMNLVIADAGPGALQLIATQAGLKLYRQCGFREIGSISQHQGTPIAVGIAPPPSGAVIRPVLQGDLAELLRLDTAAFGGDRREMIEALLALGTGIVAERDGTLQAYAIARPFGRGTLIGPVIAPDETLAISVVSHLLNSSQGFTRIDIPSDATRLADWLAAAELACVDHGAVMVRGEHPLNQTQSDLRVFGLASQGLN